MQKATVRFFRAVERICFQVVDGSNSQTPISAKRCTHRMRRATRDQAAHRLQSHRAVKATPKLFYRLPQVRAVARPPSARLAASRRALEPGAATLRSHPANLRQASHPAGLEHEDQNYSVT